MREEGDRPSDDGHGLGDREAHAAGHVQQEEDVGDDGHDELDGVDGDEPGGSGQPVPSSRGVRGPVPSLEWCKRGAYHDGSSAKLESVMVAPGGICCRQGRTRAQMLKALATGPRVPAIMGNADDANHQRLGRG